MAFVIICDACLNERHEDCVEHVGREGTFGVGFCVCKHGEPESSFVQSVRRKAEQRARREQG